jgi:hypothetical protein
LTEGSYDYSSIVGTPLAAFGDKLGATAERGRSAPLSAEATMTPVEWPLIGAAGRDHSKACNRRSSLWQKRWFLRMKLGSPWPPA